MANILCIETSTEICSVCISTANTHLGPIEYREFRHSSMLVPMIQELMKEHSIDFRDLDAIAISIGPGSYTGLRVGASTAKGLAYARDLPLIAINTLESLGRHASKLCMAVDWDFVVPMIDARRKEVYTAVFDSNFCSIEKTQALVLNDDYKEKLKNNQNYLFCGNGMNKVQEFIKETDNMTFLNSECSSLGMVELVQEQYNKKQFEELDQFSPLYLKPPNITIPKKTFHL